ncbi:retrovirus-related pol polyprotein from transposon TNT 1-94 [Tanacetum coccineum]|uniref:Retrovirus-related pol polyprotein from transposon TNT 1-94 n=1 Tax=Tanacetum coccineum TaxID=301880 RepID=A0ABQ5H1S0_9ASTR
MIKKNNTWKLVDSLKRKNAIGVKWIYKTKFWPGGSIYKHKARLVMKGYSQVAGVDLRDTFAPVVRHDTIKLLIAIAAHRNWKIHHLYVKYAFLKGELKEEMYVKQPEVFELVGQEEKVYQLYEELYGLKQTPRAWYAKIDAHLYASDNKSPIAIAELPVLHGRSKHMKVKYQVSREAKKSEEIKFK